MDQNEPQSFSFNEFTLDMTRGRLFRGDEAIKLRPKSFQTLRHLVENHGRLISKNELIASVWPDTAVTDDSLVQCLIEVRRALGKDGPQLVKTVPRRGYIFDADVQRNGVLQNRAESETAAVVTPVTRSSSYRRIGFATVVMLLVLGFASWLLWRDRAKSSTPEIKTLAVLPFRSQTAEASEDYLGLGIANEVITKISQTGSLTVRPTSAVRKYANQQVDVSQAARELQVDAVLDGTYLRVGDQLRITVNLVKVTDGTSLWAEKFDQRFTDIFAIQDRVSQQVVQKLWVQLSPAKQAQLTKRFTSNPIAYSYYTKAMYHFYNIGPTRSSRSDSTLSIDLFKKAIDLDPEYALAHAQLGYAYTRIAVFQEDNSSLIDLARNELGIAERIDPQLPEVHLARSFIAFSQYEGWSVEKAMRELRLAQEFDPNVGHAAMLDLYAHIGLEEQTKKELDQALKLDPDNAEVKTYYINGLLISARPDEALEASQRLLNREPDLRYFLEKRNLKEAERLAAREYETDSDAVWKFVYQILLKALRGKHEEAQAAIPTILAKERRYRGYHHDTYNIARIYALGGKSDEAVKWLRITVTEGFPHYPLFARDTFLDPIRSTPAFKEFMADIKRRWEGYQRQFG